MSNPISLALIGCGKMGGALLEGWLDKSGIASISVLEPGDLPPELTSNPKVTHYRESASLADALSEADVVVLAVKPQIMNKACAQIQPHIGEKALILSIAAGQTIASFEERFGAQQPVIRAMPNTPAAIGKGITVVCANSHVSGGQKENAQDILGASGLVEWTEDEGLFDAVTAVSGSGPAYLFLLIEMLAKAGEGQGLDAGLAMKLARQTVIGSAALAENFPDVPAAQLRENVTSPGGTTQAALEVLMNGELQALFDKAIAAAANRGKEL